MRLEWDEKKNQSNRAKHKIGFETACLVFNDPLHRSIQDRMVGGEERWQTLGTVGGMVILLVAHTVQTKDGEEVIRIISARKATPTEREAYEKGL